MNSLPERIRRPVVNYLKKLNVDSNEISAMLEWIQNYLEFCKRFEYPASSERNLSLYVENLKYKQHALQNIEQAQRAIGLFLELVFALQQENKPNDKTRPTKAYDKNKRSDKHVRMSWETELNQLDSEIRSRQYSKQTLKSYVRWVNEFQSFLKSKPPALIDSEDAKVFIAQLAVERGVSASTQNVAFNAILFFFRFVMKSESQRACQPL